MSRVRWLGESTSAETPISNEEKNRKLLTGFLLITLVFGGFFAAMHYAGSAAEEGKKVRP